MAVLALLVLGWLTPVAAPAEPGVEAAARRPTEPAASAAFPHPRRWLSAARERLPTHLDAPSRAGIAVGLGTSLLLVSIGGAVRAGRRRARRKRDARAAVMEALARRPHRPAAALATEGSGGGAGPGPARAPEPEGPEQASAAPDPTVVGHEPGASVGASQDLDRIFRAAWEGKLRPRRIDALDFDPPRYGSEILDPPPAAAAGKRRNAPAPATASPRQRPEPATAPNGSADDERFGSELERVISDAWARELAEPEAVGTVPEPVAGPDPQRAPGGPTAREHARPEPASVEHDREHRIHRVSRLLADGRAQEAADLAREGLALDPQEGRWLLQLSRAEAGLGRLDDALDLARRAQCGCGSRESASHLLRLLITSRRFEPEDGVRLRRALARNPDAPLLLHAAGVFEALHGDPWAARGLLTAALGKARRGGPDRTEIARELARLDAHEQWRRDGEAAAPDGPEGPKR